MSPERVCTAPPGVRHATCTQPRSADTCYRRPRSPSTCPTGRRRRTAVKPLPRPPDSLSFLNHVVERLNHLGHHVGIDFAKPENLIRAIDAGHPAHVRDVHAVLLADGCQGRVQAQEARLPDYPCVEALLATFLILLDW